MHIIFETCTCFLRMTNFFFKKNRIFNKLKHYKNIDLQILDNITNLLLKKVFFDKYILIYNLRLFLKLA